VSVPFVIVSILYLLGCASLVGAILLQKKRSAGGMGSVAGMGNVTATHVREANRRHAEAKLELLTKIGAVVLAVLAVVLCLI